MTHHHEMGDFDPTSGVNEEIMSRIPGLFAHGVSTKGFGVLDHRGSLLARNGGPEVPYDEEEHGPIAFFYQVGEEVPAVEQRTGRKAVHTHADHKWDGFESSLPGQNVRFVYVTNAKK